MGASLCLCLLPAYADCPHGLDTLSAGCADVHPDGVGPAYGHRSDLHRHHHLLDDGRSEGRHLGRRHTGYYSDRRCPAVSGHPDVLNA